jgi:putative lipoic acid-binding regulatory protein
MDESLIKFPCEFTIKIFGNASDEFEINVLSIIRKHLPELREDAIRIRPSQDKKYMAMSVTIYTTSKEQLDTLYRALSSSPHVLMVL